MSRSITLAAMVALLAVGGVRAQVSIPDSEDAPFRTEEWRALRREALLRGKDLGSALLVLASKNDDRYAFRSAAEAWEKLRPLLKNQDALKTANPAGGEWVFNKRIYNAKVTWVERPDRFPVLWESKPWADGRRTVVYADGHSYLAPADKFPGIISEPIYNDKHAPLRKKKG